MTLMGCRYGWNSNTFKGAEMKGFIEGGLLDTILLDTMNFAVGRVLVTGMEAWIVDKYLVGIL